MVLKADRERVKALLTETITLLCKNGLNYQSEFAIEALIGITLDRDDVFLVSIKETICSDLGIDKDYVLHDDRQDDRREFHVETTRTSRVEATRISQEDLKDGLESAPDLSIMVQLDKSDDGRLEDTPNGSSALVPQKLFRSMHADNSSMDMADTHASQSSDSTPSSFGMREFDTGTSTTGGGDTSRREHSTDRSDHKHSMDRSDHLRQPTIKRQRTDDSGDWSVKEEEDSDDDVVVIKEEAGLDTLSCQLDAYNQTGMFDTSGSVSHDAISGMTAAANVLPHTLTLSSSAPVFPGCSSWDQLSAIGAQHSLPPSTASSNTTMSNTASQQMSQSGLPHAVWSHVSAMDEKSPTAMMIPLGVLPSCGEGTVKRQRKGLSMEDKLKIIERLEEGASHGKVAKEFAIGRSTVGDIKKKKDQVRLFVSTLDTKAALKRKKLFVAKDVPHEAAVYQWYVGETAIGIYVTGSALAQKAKLIYWQMHHADPGFNPEAFRATNGWLSSFKERHGISFHGAPKHVKNTDA